MGFFDNFDDDDAAHLVEDLGEEVVYLKRRNGVIERRAIDAIVHRQPNRNDAGASNGSGTIRVRPIRIVFANGGARGIAPAEIDTGLDAIELCRVSRDLSTLCQLQLHMPSEKERTQNDERLSTFELY